MGWWEAVPALLSALLLGILPGLVIAGVLGLRGTALAGLAPAFSISTIAIASVVAPMLGVAWGVVAVLATTVAITALAGAFRLIWIRFRPTPAYTQDPQRLMVWWALGLGFAVVAITVRFMISIMEPDRISQSYDNIFHLNALRYVLDSGNASSLSLGGFPGASGGGSFYPAAWHAFTTLVVETSGSTIPVAVNAVAIVMGAAFWPIACMFLVRQLTGARPLAMVATGVLASAFAAFPYLLIDFGVLYPYMLGLSLLPAALAVVIVAARLAVDQTFGNPTVWIALLGVIPGLALAHPSVFLSLVALSAPLGLYFVVFQLRELKQRRAPRWNYVVLVSLWGAAYLATAVIWVALRNTFNWPSRVTLAQSVGEALLNAHGDLPIALGVSVLMIVGLVVLLRQRRLLWFLGMVAVVMVLYVLAEGADAPRLRVPILGVWYSDPYRLAALVPVAVLPLCVVAFVWIHDRLLRLWQLRTPRSSTLFSTIMVIALILATQLSNINYKTIESQEKYIDTEEAALLTADELALLERVDATVPEGVVVAGNPWTGAGLVYAIADRSALYPHVGGFDTIDATTLSRSLRAADANDEVCAALDRTGVGYVLDFGRQEVHNGRHPYPGFQRLENSTAVELVDEEGEAKLYRITACGL